MIRSGPLKVKAQLFCDQEGAIGPGRADLLEAIEKHGSISAAGRAMGMSYRRAWLLVDSMNRCWRDRLVDTLVGGGSKRGAHLTESGREVLNAYRALEAQMAQAAQPQLDVLADMLRRHPLMPREPS